MEANLFPYAETMQDKKNADLDCNIVSSELSTQLFSAINAMNGGIALYQMHPDGHFSVLYVSSGVAHIVGLTVDEYMKRYQNHISDFIHPSDLKMLLSMVRTAVQDGKTTSLTYRSLHKNGTYVWTNGVFAKQSEKDGLPIVQAVFTPASQQFDLQTEALNQTQTGIYVVDLKTRELYYSNEAGFQIFEKKPHDYTGMPCHKIFFDRDTPCEFCCLSKVLSGEKSTEIFAPSLNKYLLSFGEISKWAGKDVLVEYLTDITAARSEAVRLRESEQALESATEHAGIWYWIYDWKSDKAFIGQRAQKDFGLPEEMENTLEWWRNSGILDTEYLSTYIDIIRQIQAGVPEVMLDCKGHMPDGSAHWARVIISNLYDENGQPMRAVGTARIIDDIKELEHKYELERKHSLMDDTSLIAHAAFNLSHVRTFEMVRHAPLIPLENRMTFQEFGKNISEAILGDEQREQFLSIYNREYLLREYNNGKSEFTIEYRRTLPNGKSIWVRSSFHLIREPGGIDLLLFYYCNDINKQKCMEIMMSYTASDDYDMMGCMNFHDDSAILLYGKGSFFGGKTQLTEENYTSSYLQFA